MKKKVFGLVSVIAGSAILLASCASTKNDTGIDYDQSYANKDYSSCIQYLQENTKNPVINDLDVSMLYVMNRDYMSSARSFVSTQQEMQQLSADMNVGKVIQASATGEESIEYTGAVYERLLAYSMKAFDALKMGEIDRAVGVFNEYSGNYKEEISTLLEQNKELEAACESLLNSDQVKTAIKQLANASLPIKIDGFVDKIPSNKSTDTYEVSPFLCYLGMLTSLANDDSEHAKDFLQLYLLADPKSAVNYKNEFNVPNGKGVIDVVTLSDTIGKKSQAEVKTDVGTLPYSDVYMTFKIVYPTFDFADQNHTISVSSISLSNGEKAKVCEIENFDKAVSMDAASKAKGAYYRSLFRNIVKNGSAAAAGYESLNQAYNLVTQADNQFTKIAAQKAYDAAVLGVNSALNAVVESEKADLRQANYYPYKADFGSFTVDPGTYTVTVTYSNGFKESIENVVVKAAQHSIVVSECLN